MRIRLICLSLMLTAAATACIAQTPQAAANQSPTGTPAPVSIGQAQRTLDVLRDDKSRAALIETLETIAKAAPVAPTPVPPLQPESLGAQLIVQISQAVSEAGAQVVATLNAVNDLPLLWRWLAAQATDPTARNRMLDSAWKLAIVLVAAVAVERLGTFLLRRVRRALARGASANPNLSPGPYINEPIEESGLAAAEAGESERSARQRRLTGALSALRRLPFLLGQLILDLVPIALFGLVGNLLLGTELGEPPLTRLAIIAIVQIYVAVRLILAVTALLVSPSSSQMRLVQVSDWAAAFLTRWIRRITIVALSGYGVAEVGLLFGMYRTAYEALLKLFALVVHICLVVAVLQAREPVARRIHSRHNSRGAWAITLNRISEIWHLVAIFYIVALWLVWAIELRNGYVRLIRFFIVTAGVMIIARLFAVVVLGGFDRLRVGPGMAARHPGMEARLNAYYPLVRSLLMIVIGILTAVTLAESWGFGIIGWFQYTGLGSRSVSAVLLIGVTMLLAVLTWEGANAGIEMHLTKLGQQAQLARAGRLRTLLPMLRTVLLVTILLVVALMSLSELGVNIAPLLAGAGVVGIAVGFGSQKLVQDLITGLFLLLENAMQVGDVVTLGGLSGTVEALSIRTIRLRALDGSIHIIPFSAVTTVTNQTRDYGYAVLDISVGLNEEPGRIIEVLKTIAAEMRADAKWQSILLDSLDIMGIEKFVDTAWVLRARIKTQPSSRWAVGRELNRRIKDRFDELAIESPFTSYRALSTATSPAPEQEKPA